MDLFSADAPTQRRSPRELLRTVAAHPKVRKVALIFGVVLLLAVAYFVLMGQESQGLSVTPANERRTNEALKQDTQESHDAGAAVMPGSDVPALDERNENAGAKDPGKLVVYVTGAVVQPGLVSLAQGSRIGDAVSAAGGMRDDAAPAAVNLAELVDDGIHVHIPTQGEVPATQGADTPLLSGGTSGQTGAGVPLGASSAKGSSSSASGSTSGKVNINTADATTLQTLDGVGPATAQKIIDYRNAQGPFRSKDDLKNVSGIGEKKFAALVDRIAV